MSSLKTLISSYKNKKLEAIKRRRQSQRKLESAISLKRRSSSGLASLERRKEATIRKRDEISRLLTQFLAQQDSIKRLKIAAEDRLNQEQEAKDRVQQEIEFASSPEEKTRALERLRIIDEKIGELNSGIKQRNAIEGRLSKLVADNTKSKSKIEAQIRQLTGSKPSLLDQLKSSEKAEKQLRPEVKSRQGKEIQAGRILSIAQQRLELLRAKRRKQKRKAKKKPKRKIIKSKRKAKQRRKRPARKTRTKARRAKTRTRKARRTRTKARRTKTRTRKVRKTRTRTRKRKSRLKRNVRRKARKGKRR